MHFLSGMRPEALPPFVLLVNPRASPAMSTIRTETDGRTGIWRRGGRCSAAVPSRRSGSGSAATPGRRLGGKRLIPRIRYFRQEKRCPGLAIRRMTDTVRLGLDSHGSNADAFFRRAPGELGILQTVRERRSPGGAPLAQCSPLRVTPAAPALEYVSQRVDERSRATARPGLVRGADRPTGCSY